MYAYGMKSNVIKWWQIIYNPNVRRIFPSNYEEELYEEAEAQRLETEAAALQQESLLHNSSYNASTGSMSGEYGKGEMNDSEKAQLDAILKSNYSSIAGIDALKIDEPEMNEEDKRIARLCDTSNLSPEEAAEKEEQLRRANEIYERLLHEAKMDELERLAEIEAAREAAN